MNYVETNCNRKISLFIKNDIELEVLLNTEQQLIIKIELMSYNMQIIATIVYAKCTESERLPLWNNIYQLAKSITMP